ncbi:hypothetical protein P879_11223 [Paragonimus westermani]|uniref:Uncharacterized protein n=1 Tax=Paragonimus westermani TaxID=34504 RepID=A0A8T0D8I0_9TREM|nr:hypothetical protein P879_11223 [Paragonimus westermani]
MYIQEDHGAPLLSSVVHSWDTALTVQAHAATGSSFYPLGYEHHRVSHHHHIRAFVVLDSASSLTVTIGTHKPKPFPPLVILLIVCLWRIYGCAANLMFADTGAVRRSEDYQLSANAVLNLSISNITLSVVPRDSTWFVRTKREVPAVSPPVINRSFRRSIARMDGQEPKHLTPELIDFICHRIPDPCARAAYLRQHVRHALCTQLPLLYLLPYVVTPNSRSNWQHTTFRTGMCDGGLTGLAYVNSDSLFEPWLNPPVTCEYSLSQLHQLISARVQAEFINFEELLNKSFCKRPSDSDYNMTGEFRCEECHNAYKNWLCASEFPLYVSLDDSDFARPPQSPNLSNTAAVFDNFNHSDKIAPTFSSMTHKDSLLSSDRLTNSSRKPLPRFRSYAPSSSERQPISPTFSSENFRLSVIPLCNSWCTQVETVCPYFNPQDSTSNGGEPAFLCHGKFVN